MSGDKVIFVCPGGRQNILSVQLMYMLKILDLDVVFEYHIWDFSWNESDSNYISQLTDIHPKIRVKYSPYSNASRAGEIASKQFAYFLSEYYKHDTYSDYIFIKLDDDICFIDVTQFEKFVEGRRTSKAFLYSANIVNNYYLGGDNFDTIHNAFISNYNNVLSRNHAKNIETFSNENRLSINFVSFLGSDLKYINDEFSNGVGSNDEWRLCHTIPKRLDRDNEICLFMTVVHYAFGGHINPVYIDRYIEMGKSNDLHLQRGWGRGGERFANAS